MKTIKGYLYQSGEIKEKRTTKWILLCWEIKQQQHILSKTNYRRKRGNYQRSSNKIGRLTQSIQHNANSETLGKIKRHKHQLNSPKYST